MGTPAEDAYYAAINKQAAKNNATAATLPKIGTATSATSKNTVPLSGVKNITGAGPSGYGMLNTNAAATINRQALANNVASTQAGGYGMNNVAAANYINQLAKTTPARATPGTTVKNPTWSPISGMASYELPTNFDYGQLNSHFLPNGFDSVNWGYEPGGANNPGGVPVGGLGGAASGGMGSALGGAMGGAMGGGGMGGMSGIGSALGSMLGGGMGGGAGGGTGATVPPAPEPEKPKPQRYYAGGYTTDELNAQDSAALGNRDYVKGLQDAKHSAASAAKPSEAETKAKAVREAQTIAQNSGGMYDLEGKSYSQADLDKIAKEESDKKAKDAAGTSDGKQPYKPNGTPQPGDADYQLPGMGGGGGMGGFDLGSMMSGLGSLGSMFSGMGGGGMPSMGSFGGGASGGGLSMPSGFSSGGLGGWSVPAAGSGNTPKASTTASMPKAASSTAAAGSGMNSPSAAAAINKMAAANAKANVGYGQSSPSAAVAINKMAAQNNSGAGAAASAAAAQKNREDAWAQSIAHNPNSALTGGVMKSVALQKAAKNNSQLKGFYP